MHSFIDRKAVRRRIRYRIRKKISGSAGRPRVAVFRSQKHIYAQAIDDDLGKTLAHVSSQDATVVGEGTKSWDREAAKLVGSAIAEKLKASGIETVVFDRGGNIYQGRVKALADAMREAGLKL
jgi:large subunit ribosomal protein L18